jgi:prepilin-type N-terminal cleavage/methylation domain-containing protein
VSRTPTSSLINRLLPRRGEAGFTVIEILVAMVLFALLATAAVPLLITSLRASVVTKLDTGAKNLTQQRFDLMRNMPFRIAYDPLVVTSRDILDQYYPDLVAPSGGVETKGYVTTQARRDGEPTTGPFYRTKFTPTLGSTTYTQWVAVQFLTPKTKVPIAPTVPYDAFSLNDLAPSTLLGVTVITEWKIRDQSKRYTVYSQIGDVAPAAPLLSLQGRVTALKVSSTLGSGTTSDLLLEAGIVNLDGGIASATTAAVSAQGARASITPGAHLDGARQVAQAPPDVAAGSVGDNGGVLFNGSDPVAQIPRTDAANVSAKTAGGLPSVATSASPATASAYGSADLWFSNRPNLADSALGLSESTFVVRQPSSTGTTVQARATAFAASTQGASHSGAVSMSAATDWLRVLPTSFAPDGLVQLRLTSSTLGCSSTGAAVASTPAYTASVLLRRWDGSSASWIAFSTSSTQTSDPLASVDLATWPVGQNNGRTVYLGEYLTSLSSQTATSLTAANTATNGGRGTDTRISAMVGLTTVPLRSGEDLSNVNVQLGVMTCGAEDNR